MRMIDQYKDEIKIEDLPEVYQIIAENSNLEVAILIATLFEGGYIYFPKIDQFLQNIRDKKIAEEFGGDNYLELAQKYNLSEIRIRQIVQRSRHHQTTLDEFIQD